MNLYPEEKSRVTLQCLESLIDTSKYKTFLDFGGNQGNLLKFDSFKIKPENYTCVDVDLEAIEAGSKNFPEANFVHYDRFSSVYNHTGSKKYKFPVIDKNQDIIFAFSVFTHTNFNELKETINWFKTFKYKKIIISLLDKNDPVMINHFYQMRLKRYKNVYNMTTFPDDTVNMIYMIDNNDVIYDNPSYVEDKCTFFLTFYDMEMIKRCFEDCKIEVHNRYPFMVFDNETL